MLGGQATFLSSMGTSFAGDMQKSLADTVQAMVAIRGLDWQGKIGLSKEVTSRYEMGQITIRQRDAIMGVIAGARTGADLTLGLARLGFFPTR